MPSDAEIDLSSLPGDQRDVVADLLREHAELLAANAALTAEASDLKQIVQRLEHLVAERNHVVHGKKSEKLGEDDRQLAFEDLEIAVAEVETQQDDRAAASEAPRRKVTPAQRNRGNLPADLPRIEQTVEPDSLEWSPLEAPLVRATMATRLRADVPDRRRAASTPSA